MFTEDQEEVVESADTTTDIEDNQEDYEDDSDSEGEGETQAEESEQRKPEAPEAKLARLKRQYEREAKKQGAEDSTKSKESTKDSSKEKDEKYNRLDLKLEGIKDKKEQDEVLDYMDWKGVDVSTALNSAVVKTALKEIRDKAATPRPSTRTSKGTSTSVDSLVSKYRAGRLLTNDEMRQVRKKLRG